MKINATTFKKINEDLGIDWNLLNYYVENH